MSPGSSRLLHKMSLMVRRAAAYALLLFLPSCALFESSNYLRAQLADKGISPVSGKNPFVATNMLLSREMEASPTLRGFLRYRGAPDAIEIKKKYFGPYRFNFFYVKERERYLLEEHSDDWVIKGPEQVDPEIAKSLSDIPSLGGKAAFADAAAKALAQAKPAMPEPAPAPEEPEKHEPAENFIENTGPAPSPGIVESTEPAAKAEPEASPKPANEKPASAEPIPTVVKGEDLAAPSGTATEPETGDVIHRVTYTGETLRIIAGWYTGDPANAPRIARINAIRNADLLYLGQAVRIPRYLVKTSSPLKQEEVERYINSQAGPQLKPAPLPGS